MRYSLIGIDLDGTLLNGNIQVSDRNRQAIARAVQAGAQVVPCTGRAWRKSQHFLKDVSGLELGVFVAGAMIAEIATGRNMDLAFIEPDLAMEIVQALRHEPEAVLVFQDSTSAGRDYLVTGEGEMIDGTQRWFDKYKSKVHIKRQPEAHDLRYTLQIGMRVTQSRVKRLEALVRAKVGDRVAIHSVATPSRCNGEPTAKLEIFAAGAHKWRGIEWLAQRHDIPRDAIATIGDDFNDLPMLQNAACGVAMGNAVDAAKAASKYVTATNHEDGVALAIDKMLAGEW